MPAESPTSVRLVPATEPEPAADPDPQAEMLATLKHVEESLASLERADFCSMDLGCIADGLEAHGALKRLRRRLVERGR